MLPFESTRDAVHGEALARLPAAVAEARENLHRLAQHDVDLLVLAVGEEHVLLLRILRERDVPHRAVAERVGRDEHFLHERAVRLEDLDAIVRAVADVDAGRRSTARRSAPGCGTAVIGGAFGIVGAEIRVVRLVAVRAPVALELAGVGVDDDDALVAVAVGDVGLVGLRDRRRSSRAGRSSRCRCCPCSARACRSASRNLPSCVNFRSCESRPDVAADPDVALVVDGDAVIRRRASHSLRPGPPQWPTTLPAGSNSSTGGAVDAARRRSAGSGSARGFVRADRLSRWTIHT